MIYGYDGEEDRVTLEPNDEPGDMRVTVSITYAQLYEIYTNIQKVRSEYIVKNGLGFDPKYKVIKEVKE